MARSKKTRKVGLIGVRKDPNFKPSSVAKPTKRKPKKGKPAGSRHNVESDKRTVSKSTKQEDPRKGSKKPIPLIASPVATVKVKKFASPAEELAYLESDQRLQSLLDNLDEGKKLSAEQQAYVDEKMARHKILCELMGITPDDEDEQESDPFADLNSISLDDYKE